MFSRLKSLFSRQAAPSHVQTEQRGESPQLDPQAWERLAEQPLSVDAQLAVANQRMTEEVIRQRIRENVRKFKEASNPASLWALSFVDPYDWAMDSPDFYPGLGLGGGWGVPWLLNNQGRGDLLPVYINEMGLKIIRDWSRRICAFNEFALNAVENRISYIVGKGFQYSVVPKKKSTTPAQSLNNEEGNEPTRLVQLAQAVLDEFISRERWSEREQECVRRCDRDGEAFLRFFHVGNGRTCVRFVEPEYVTQGQAYQAGDQRVTQDVWRQYGINVAPGDIEDVQSYAIVENPTDGWVTCDIEAKDVLHIKANVDFNNKRGLPTLFPVRKNLERADKLLRNMSVMAQVRATFAVIRKHKQFGPSSVSAFQQAATDQNVSVPVSGRNLSLRQMYPGSIIDASDKTEYEFPGADVDAAGLVEVLQAELRAIAARLVMPEWMLTVDASNGNFAGQFVAEAPWSKFADRLQCFYARHFGDGCYGQSQTIGAMWRVLENAVDAGLLPREVLSECEIQAEGPSTVARDKQKETDRAAKLNEAGILSEETWSKWEGLDRQQELQLGAKAKPKAAANPLGGMGGETPQPAPPGSAEGMSEAILREDEGRWVTIGGQKSQDGKRHGGSPVFIKDGKIVKGAPSLAGKRVDSLKKGGGGKSLTHEIHAHLSKGGTHSLGDLRRQFGHEKVDKRHPEKNPVHAALKAMRDTGHVETIGGQFGEPSFKATSKQGDLPTVEEPSSHRQDLNREKDYERAKYAKAARKEGIEPKHLHSLADEIAAHDREHVERRKQLLADARKTLSAKGYDARALTTNLRSGRVEDKIPFFDELADEMAKRYPDQFNGEEDAESRLKDLLAEGNPEAMSQADAYEQALSQLRDMRANEPEEEPEPDEDEDEGGGDLGADEEGDPFSFDFGANAKPEKKAGDEEDEGGYLDMLLSAPSGPTMKDSLHSEAKGKYNEASKRVEELAAQIKDWESRKYKPNKARVSADVGDEHSGETTIGAANERRRARVVRGLYKELQQARDEQDKAKRAMDRLASESPAAGKEEPEKAAPSRQEARVNAAKARYEHRGETAKGGGLFGGEDMQARAGFRKLPDGAGVLFVGGEFEGKTGKIVHDFDPTTGHPRIVAEVEGRPGLVPITPDAIEPLDAHLSWRTDTAYGETKQGGLFTADQFLKPRNG